MNKVNILTPSANNRSKHDLGKDKFIITPSKNTSSDLSFYKFLGVLIGTCLRTGVHLTLDLPAFFWKPLVGQKITFQDIMEIDAGFCDLLKFMQESDKEMFETTIMESFQVNLSDGSL
jgi:hypothetical protein